VGNPEHGFEMIRAVAALRRGAAKDFLVYGRMLQPAPIEGIRTMEWTYEDKAHRAPAVFDATWQAPDGRVGIVLANWTPEAQTVRLTDTRLPETGCKLHLSAAELTEQTLSDRGAEIVLPPRSCALVV
jgi:hypothetical protein